MEPDALIEGIWNRDPGVWTGSDEAKWLGWLDEPVRIQDQLEDIRRFAESCGFDVASPAGRGTPDAGVVGGSPT